MQPGLSLVSQIVFHSIKEQLRQEIIFQLTLFSGKPFHNPLTFPSSSGFFSSWKSWASQPKFQAKNVFLSFICPCIIVIDQTEVWGKPQEARSMANRTKKRKVFRTQGLVLLLWFLFVLRTQDYSNSLLIGEWGWDVPWWYSVCEALDSIPSTVAQKRCCSCSKVGRAQGVSKLPFSSLFSNMSNRRDHALVFELSSAMGKEHGQGSRKHLPMT